MVGPDRPDGAPQGDERDAQGSVAESLRAAVERTFAATADSAAETRGRAQQLLDEVSKRGQEAREASAGAASKVVDAAERVRLSSREEVRALEARVEELTEATRALSARVSALESKPRVEG